MKSKIIKKLALASILVLSLSTTVFADEGGKQIEKTMDGIKVDLVLKGDNVKKGDNELTVKLYDEKGQPIGNANVKVTASMGGDMGSMQMSGMQMGDSDSKAVDFKAGQEKGEYTGTVNFSDKGKWTVKTDFMAQGQDKMVDFDVDVVDEGPNWFIIGGFLAVNAIIIISAGIMKKKNTKTTKAA